MAHIPPILHRGLLLQEQPASRHVHTSHHHTHTSHHHAHAPLWGRAPVRLAEPADAAGVAHGDVADARQVVVWPAFAHLGE